MGNKKLFLQPAFGCLWITLIVVSLHSPASGQTEGSKRKVVLEEFCGTWCHWCPLAAYAMDSIQVKMGDRVIEFGWHFGDTLEIAASRELVDQIFGIERFPTALTDRKLSFIGNGGTPNEQHPWYTALAADASSAPEVDIRIVNVQMVDSVIQFDVETTPLNLVTMASEDTTKYALFVALTEDGVIAPQLSWVGDTVGTIHTIEDFVHNNVVRSVATGSQGDVFDIGTRSKIDTYPIRSHYSLIRHSDWNPAKLRVKTFVNRMHRTLRSQFILNAEQTPYLGDMPPVGPNSIWVVRPSKGAEIEAGKPTSVIWSKQGPTTSATLAYSADDGATWDEIASDVTHSPYQWTVPQALIGRTIRLRITDALASSITSLSAPFKIIAPIPVTVEVSRPINGEQVAGGKQYVVEFATTGDFGEIRKLEYTINGDDWISIADLSTTSTKYSWSVPAIDASSVRIRVTSSSGVSGVSGEFSIVTPDVIRSIVVNDGIFPLPKNTPVSVRWTLSNSAGSTFTLEYGDTAWTTLQTGISSDVTNLVWTTPDKDVSKAYLRLTSSDGATRRAGPFAIGESAAVKLSGLPTTNAIVSNFPNPFSTTSSIIYHLAQAGDVHLVVRDLMGRDIMTLESCMHPPGVYSSDLDASDLAAGTYIVTLLINGEAYSRTVSVAK
jgi:hypothetical protein